ncbi:hypothetical protein [Silanimonas lenta]|uniref:hypothetical protein n=1 Tax=Silanimonas lenta TaxID=265429 RepID=UPI0003FF13A4|nr:hypothetical protein [Silanimonas lenta]
MPRLSFSGFDRDDEAKARRLFEGLGLPGWSIAEEAAADVVLVDLDSMYGQMAWMRGFAPGVLTIGLTQALRADTTYRLEAPLTATGLAAVLATIGSAGAAPGNGSAKAPAVPASPPAPPPREAEALPPRPVEPPPAAPVSAPPAPSAAPRLAARLAAGSGAFSARAPGLPELVVDLDRQQFAPGRSLKALLPYATLDPARIALSPLTAETAAEALARAGEPQPLARLAWLLALGGGEGRLQGHAAGTRFQLDRWPQVEREFPKHFRIATVMLKAPATVEEIAAASGASEAEVADYVNAALAAGHASVR